MEGIANVIDFTPLVNLAVGFVVTALGTVATLVGLSAKRWIEQKFGFEVDIREDMVRARIDDVLEKAVQMGLNKLDDDGVFEVKTTSDVLAVAANFAKKAIPESLAKFNITDEFLEDMIRARLGSALGSGTRSAVTAPVSQ